MEEKLELKSTKVKMKLKRQAMRREERLYEILDGLLYPNKTKKLPDWYDAELQKIKMGEWGEYNNDYISYYYKYPVTKGEHYVAKRNRVLHERGVKLFKDRLLKIKKEELTVTYDKTERLRLEKLILRLENNSLESLHHFFVNYSFDLSHEEEKVKLMKKNLPYGSFLINEKLLDKNFFHIENTNLKKYIHIIVSNELLQTKNMSLGAKVTYAFLCTIKEDSFNGFITISKKKIAKILNFSKRTIFYHLKQLEKNGYIVKDCLHGVFGIKIIKEIKATKYFKVKINDIREFKELIKTGELLLFNNLVDLYKKTKNIYIGNKALVNIFGVCKNTIKRWLLKLETLGFIRRVKTRFFRYMEINKNYI